MVSGIHTHGELLHWHPHIHALVTCGAFTPEGVFLELPEFDMASLLLVWQEAVFALYLAEGKIEAQVVENMRTWRHTGFSIDQSVFLPAGDHKGIERLVQYITRCPFSLSRLVKVTGTGQVVLKAEKAACRAFPDPKGDGIASGPKRNFQLLSPLDFLAEFTQHIPPKSSHLIRYYGWYSNKARGMRRKAEAAVSAAAAQTESSSPPASRCSRTWAMLIKRVYEVDPLACPHCGGEMKVVAFIEPPPTRGHRIDPAPLRPLAGAGFQGPTRCRRLGPRPGFRLLNEPECISRIRSVPTTDLRGHRHLLGHLLTNTVVGWHGEFLSSCPT